MARFITLSIECYKGDFDERLEKMGIDQSEEVEFRPCGFIPDNIEAFYPSNGEDEVKCYVVSGGQSYRVREDYSTVGRLINS